MQSLSTIQNQMKVGNFMEARFVKAFLNVPIFRLIEKIKIWRVIFAKKWKMHFFGGLFWSTKNNHHSFKLKTGIMTHLPKLG